MAKAIKTLADVKKGDSVFMFLFSGAPVGRGNTGGNVVSAATEKTISVETNSGTKQFSRKTGVQIGANNPRYSNFILASIDDEAGKEAGKAAVKAFAVKATKAEEVEEAPKKAKKPKAEAPAAKPAKAKKTAEIVEDDEDDWDE